MPTRLPLALALALLALPPAAAGQAPGGRVPLTPGPFAPLPGTRLGEAEVFEKAARLPENPPVPTACAPLAGADGGLLGWLAAAAVAEGRLYVRRCVEEGGRPAAGVRGGGEALEWESVGVAGDGTLRWAPLALPDWSFYSNPAFCGRAVAYWAMAGGELRVQVYDLDARRLIGSRARGEIYLVADESDALEAPTWDAGCRRASFRASRLGSRTVTLDVE